MRTLALGIVLCGVTLSSAVAHPSETGTPADAVAIVQRVRQQFDRDGAEATLKAISEKTNPEFSQGGLYPFVFDLDGVNVGNGARTALIGKNLISVRDQDGRYPIREMIEIAKGPGSGWIKYKWPNPLSKTTEEKTSYVERMGDYLVGVGLYRPAR